MKLTGKTRPYLTTDAAIVNCKVLFLAMFCIFIQFRVKNFAKYTALLASCQVYMGRLR